MADLSHDEIGTDAALGAGSFVEGHMHHVRLPFISQTCSAGDTFTLGNTGDYAIARAAWESTGSAGGCVAVSPAGQYALKRVTWVAGSSDAGYLHLWITG